ncbi:CRISPR-associated endonuclease Cas1 [Acanthopleuribacter pedis]|uniref:CRISPR-associated endonuclease Cas1 n=1 Tax=Acanthopleuribacter pedis TaxID=442870 RepID=A0A8J7Q5I2_9BACT|nr:CRISPR-associated endonuclease Cas1 [Acanthopleuribacter pedis]MBO1318507.1 CRISPR-associated endonuclease Cas1 [Acanthopleuribacter pedis]
MNVNLLTEGGLLHVRDGMFELITEKKKTPISPVKIERILVSTRMRLTSDVLVLALQHKIDVLFMDHFGDPVGRLWQPVLGSTTRIRKQQCLWSLDGRGLEQARAWLLEKLDGQAAFLQDLAKRRTAQAELLREAAAGIAAAAAATAADDLREPGAAARLRGFEGSAGRCYFTVLAEVIPEAYRFEGRSRRPARDPFNAMLNYGYGVLYGYVEKACLVAGLDPHLGFMHRDDYNQRSFVYDFIEPYRVEVGRCVVSLFTRKQVRRTMFTPIANGFTLAREGKEVLITALHEVMRGQRRQGKRKVQLKHAVQLAAHAFATDLLESAALEAELPEDERAAEREAACWSG